MQEEYAIRRYEQAAALLPMRWQRLARQLPDWQKARAEEPAARGARDDGTRAGGGRCPSPARRRRPW